MDTAKSMKRKNYFRLAALLVPLTLSLPAKAESKPQDLLKLFPICSVQSSLGQTCKYKPEKIKSSFSLVNLPDGTVDLSVEGSIFVSTDDWYYSLLLKHQDGNGFVITFSDDAKHGSYHVVTDYFVRKNSIGNWEMFAEEVTYLCCSPEDASAVLNKKFKIVPPVELLKF